MSTSIQKKITLATAIILTVDAWNALEESENNFLEYEAVILSNLERNLPIIRISRVMRPKTMGFWVDIFPNLSDENPYNNFKCHFRIMRTTFNRLLSSISAHPIYQFSTQKPQTPIEIQVAIVLQRLANPMSYRQLETTFGIGQGSVTNFTNRFITAVLDNLRHIINWPRGEELQRVIEGFAPPELRSRIPNVIGAIDGSHIPISQPRIEYHQRYINRKGFYSVVLMAIVDDRERFIYIYSGQPGSMHDARVLKQSAFWREVVNDSNGRFPGNTHILGDSAFPLMPWLLVPFKRRSSQELSRVQRQYNRIHSSARIAVERAFGKLKGRWRILRNNMEVTDLKNVVDIID
ncbi:7934_t:CDS:2, partial [Paraglomus occultum]